MNKRAKQSGGRKKQGFVFGAILCSVCTEIQKKAWMKQFDLLVQRTSTSSILVCQHLIQGHNGEIFQKLMTGWSIKDGKHMIKTTQPKLISQVAIILKYKKSRKKHILSGMALGEE